MMRSAFCFAMLWIALVDDVRAAMDLDDIRLPPGFSIDIYAEVPNARALSLGSNGVVFVSNLRADSVYAILPEGGDRNRVVEIANGLDMPNGVAYYDGDLYVAENSQVHVYRDIDNRLDDPPESELLDIDLPSAGHHGWRYIGFGPDDKLYISIGAPCNVCDNDGYARIDRMNPDGSERETWATGIRNSVGFSWHPETGDLWFTDNGRDMLGDDIPPDELNHAPVQGMHFGFPAATTRRQRKNSAPTWRRWGSVSMPPRCSRRSTMARSLLRNMAPGIGQKK
jgi:glucose/arabinose dehydrogenase